MKEHFGVLLVGLAGLVSISVPGPLQAQAPAGKLHVLLILDTLDEDIGEHVPQDRKNVERFLTNGLGSKALGLMDKTVCDEEKATWDHVFAYYKNLKVGPNDTVLCYFSGHGGTLIDGSKDHLLQLQGSGKAVCVQRGQLRQAMLAKKPRLAVLITDSCSELVRVKDVGALYEPKSGLGSKNGGGGTEVRPAFRRLFFESRGLMDINASSEGTYAWSDPNRGGLFTHHFLMTFEAQADKPDMDWLQLATLLREGTKLEFVNFKQKMIRSLETRDDPEARRQRAVLEKQHSQAPQFYHVPGVRLGVYVAPTGGKGVRVDSFTVASPTERAKILPGEDIVGVLVAGKEERIYTTNQWSQIIDSLAKETTFTFTVRGKDRTERRVRVALEP